MARVAGTGQVLIHPPMAQFLRHLRQFPERLDKEVRGEMRSMAAEVRNDARGAATAGRPQSLGRKRRTTQHWRTLVMSIRSGTTGAAPYVAMGSTSVPWALSFEFGWDRYRYHKWRGNNENAGYYLYPTVREAADDLLLRIARLRDETAQLAFPD